MDSLLDAGQLRNPSDWLFALWPSTITALSVFGGNEWQFWSESHVMDGKSRGKIQENSGSATGRLEKVRRNKAT